jgi:type IV secretion system protein VirB11
MSLTIRRPSAFAPTIEALAAGGLFSRTDVARSHAHPLDAELSDLHRARDWSRFFPLAVRAKKTIIATGDTGSGKTTFAKALIQAIPRDERLITIEDTAEFIGLPHRNLVSLFYSKGDQGQAHVRSEDLIEAALRMRPDRVLMQELRDGAAFTFIRSIAAGHPGSITTCHAGSASGAFDALRLMVKQHSAGKHLADADVRTLLRQLVDVVVHCEKREGQFRISEVFFDPSAKLVDLAVLVTVTEREAAHA